MQHWTTVSSAPGIHVAPYDFRGNAINTVAIELGDDRGVLVIGPGTTTSDAALDELDAVGPVVALASPGPYHHMGMPKWKARYPDARLFATRSGVERIPKQHKGEGLSFESTEALAQLLPDAVQVVETPGKHPDLHVSVRGDDGSCTWVTNEIVTNWPTMPASKVFALMFRMFGVGTGLEVNTMAMKLIGAKKDVTGEFLRAQLDAHPPTRLIPSHGDVLEAEDLASRLRAVVDRKL